MLEEQSVFKKGHQAIVFVLFQYFADSQTF